MRFDDVNDYVHDINREFEELQALSLGLAQSLEKAMKLIADIEPSIDEWGFPITAKDDARELCKEFYGDGWEDL